MFAAPQPAAQQKQKSDNFSLQRGNTNSFSDSQLPSLPSGSSSMEDIQPMQAAAAALPNLTNYSGSFFNNDAVSLNCNKTTDQFCQTY